MIVWVVGDLIMALFVLLGLPRPYPELTAITGSRYGKRINREQPKHRLEYRLEPAEQIGLTIPPNVLARADRVIR